MQPLDWMVMAAYAAVVLLIGWRVGRGHQSTEDFFLGNRQMPVWAVFFSMIATELSAATFMGVPQAAYNGDWNYLQTSIGSFLARFILAGWFISLYHRMGLVTVYGLLEDRFGRKPQLLGSWYFLLGRVLASGVRLYIAGLAFATVTEISMPMSILIAGVIAGVYTLAGGIRAVIWTDTLQGGVFLIAAISTMVVAILKVEGSFADLWSEAAAEGKLEVFKLPPLFTWGPSAADAWEDLGRVWHNFRTHYLASDNALPVALIGTFFLTLATHGTDQDMVQRLLTTSSGKKGGRALIMSGYALFPLVITFLFLGTCLWAFYESSVAGFDGGYDYSDAKEIFPRFVLEEMPVGLRGLIFSGLFAAAMSSMDSALNSLATTWVVDVRRGISDAAARMRETRRATVVFGMLLIGAAIFFVYYEQWLASTKKPGQEDEVTFSLVGLALGAIAVFYGALLGSFLLALVSRKRGNEPTVFVAMIAGGLLGVILFLQIVWLPWFGGEGEVISFQWRIPMCAAVTMAIAACGRRIESGRGSA